MSKVTLSSIPSGYATASAHNADNTAIVAAIENTLSRDGTGPNQMNANLDMNGYAILNQRATSGNENFIWMGTWTTGTSYAVNNLVYAPEGTELGNGLICTTAHIAGATLNGDLANWAVYVQHGASVGGIAGPASSTLNYLPQWSDTTGTTLKDGVPIGSAGGVQAYDATLASLATNTLTAANKIPYATALDTAGELTLDIDVALTANSDTTLPSQKAIKTYVDTQVATKVSSPIVAWVNFDGTGAVGTNQIITASYNISTVYKNSAGDYTITFTTPLADNKYIVNCGGTSVNGRFMRVKEKAVGDTTPATKTAATIRVWVNAAFADTPVDTKEGYITFIR